MVSKKFYWCFWRKRIKIPFLRGQYKLLLKAEAQIAGGSWEVIPFPFWKTKKVSRFCPFISYLKCNFMIILQKKLQSFPLHDLCFVWCRWNVCRSARISRNLPYAAKVLFAPLERVGANLKNGKTLKIYHCKKGALPFAFIETRQHLRVTAQNTLRKKILLKLWVKYAFQQNFHTIKLGKITVF